MKNFKILFAIFFLSLLFINESYSQDLIDFWQREAPSQATIDDDTKVFPNPFVSEIKIDCNCTGEFEYSIYSIDGREIKKGMIDIAGEVTLPVNSLVEGFYVLNIRNEEGETLLTRKLAKHY